MDPTTACGHGTTALERTAWGWRCAVCNALYPFRYWLERVEEAR